MNIIFLTCAFLFITNSKSIQDDKVLFDGVTLDHWQVIDYEGHGPVSIEDSSIIIGKGE